MRELAAMNTVLYLEYTIEDPDLEGVRAALDGMAARLEVIEGFVQARALQNTDDPRVFLLESTWNRAAPPLDGLKLEPPPGGVKTRAWTFLILEPAWDAI